MARYRRKPIVVEAVKITRTITLETIEGEVKGNPGDYLITDNNREQYICTAYDFEMNYERVKDGTDLKKLIINSLKRLKRKSREIIKEGK
ncbi:hypothetical protein [Bacillus sp. FJAT-45350]|uniref:hypothetical protein n=1 Tax=Bacillus sp. FJAT-45350 TaxID=2011014 RepID=UPI000BB772AC|nr:hypothetical protein [Bacillus sp. FJAT-45350]